MTLLHSLLAVGSGILLATTAVSAEAPARPEAQVRVIPFLDRREARVYKNDKGETMPYRLLKPKGYDPKMAYPVVVFLHGRGQRGSDNEAQLVNGVSEFFANDAAMEKFPAVVIVPQCPDGENGGEGDWANRRGGTPITKPMRLVLEVVAAAQKEFSIDSNRLYIGGLSMGGYGTWNVIQEYPDLFAAAFPICGGGNPRKAKLLAKLPLWVFHGASDNAVPPQRSREMVSAIQEAGGHPGYSEYPDVGHDSWVFAFEEPQLLPWLFAQKKSPVRTEAESNPRTAATPSATSQRPASRP